MHVCMYSNVRSSMYLKGRPRANTAKDQFSTIDANSVETSGGTAGAGAATIMPAANGHRFEALLVLVLDLNLLPQLFFACFRPGRRKNH